MRYHNPKFPGASVYVNPRSRFFYFDYQDPSTGERVRASSGKTDVDEAWQELGRRLRRSHEPSWQDAVVHFFEERKDLKPATLHQYQNSIRALDPYLSRLLLSEIDSKTLKSFMSQRRQKVTDASVRRDLATGSTIFSTAQATMPRDIPDANPFRMISKRHLKEVKRRRYLTEAEYVRIERALTREWHRIVLEVFVYTGMRHGEVLAFRKDWIHWNLGEYGEIHLPEQMTKNSEPRVLPMFPKLHDTLNDWCARQEGEYVFSKWSHADQEYQKYASFHPFWHRARLRAGVKDVRIHDLRHTFASWWVQKGGSMGSLKEMLGHADMRMVERYAHLNTEAQHRAVEEIGDLI